MYLTCSMLLKCVNGNDVLYMYGMDLYYFSVRPKLCWHLAYCIKKVCKLFYMDLQKKDNLFPVLVYQNLLDKCLPILNLLLLDQADSENDSREVPQVEDVVRFGWCWQQTLHSLFIYLCCCTHNCCAHREKVWRKFLLLRTQMS